jgi:hypothetical protein
MADASRSRWLLLIHQLPSEPAYLRVKISRRLARVGAVAIKSSVYVLPQSEATQEDFAWVRREILEGGGEAMLIEGEMGVGASDAEIEELFRRARDADYEEFIKAIQGALKGLRRKADEPAQASDRADLERFERKLSELQTLDFFAASLREPARQALAELRAAIIPTPQAPASRPQTAPRGALWVTRAGVHIDRMASAWLIRRFIDPEARFKFVSPRSYRSQAGDLRFDMNEGEFTHEGDRCSFEVLLARFDLRQAGLQALAEIVHDIDLKDGKFRRPEVAGVASAVAGIALRCREDVERIEQASMLWEALLAWFARQEASDAPAGCHD